MKMVRIFWALQLLVFTFAEAGGSDGCPVEWKRFEEGQTIKCIGINHTVANYDQNQQWCESIDSQMVSVHSQEELNFIAGIVGVSSYWLGAKVRPSDDHNKYQFSDGTTFGFVKSVSTLGSCLNILSPKRPGDKASSDCCGLLFNGQHKGIEDISCHSLGISQMCQKTSEVSASKRNSALKCPMGWTSFKQDKLLKCFVTNESRATFEENQQWCEATGGTMVSLHSEVEFAFFKGFVNPELSYWMGTKTKAHSGGRSHENVDGTPFEYPKWGTEFDKCIEPTMQGLQGMSRSVRSGCCGVTFGAEALNEKMCSTKHMQICQKLITSPIPEHLSSDASKGAPSTSSVTNGTRNNRHSLEFNLREQIEQVKTVLLLEMQEIRRQVTQIREICTSFSG